MESNEYSIMVFLPKSRPSVFRFSDSSMAVCSMLWLHQLCTQSWCIPEAPTIRWWLAVYLFFQLKGSKGSFCASNQIQFDVSKQSTQISMQIKRFTSAIKMKSVRCQSKTPLPPNRISTSVNSRCSIWFMWAGRHLISSKSMDGESIKKMMFALEPICFQLSIERNINVAKRCSFWF